jgi:hypothetical protein
MCRRVNTFRSPPKGPFAEFQPKSAMRSALKSREKCESRPDSGSHIDIHSLARYFLKRNSNGEPHPGQGLKTPFTRKPW